MRIAGQTDRQTDRRTLFSISEISKPCYFVLLARARAKDQSSGCLRQPLGREKILTALLYFLSENGIFDLIFDDLADALSCLLYTSPSPRDS